jgi:hypothetical protein
MKLLGLTETKHDENKICLKLINNQGAWKCKDCQKKIKSQYIAMNVGDMLGKNILIIIMSIFRIIIVELAIAGI